VSLHGTQRWSNASQSARVGESRAHRPTTAGARSIARRRHRARGFRDARGVRYTNNHGARDDREADDVHRPCGETREQEGDQGSPRHAPEEEQPEPAKANADRVPKGGPGERAGGDDGGVQVSARWPSA